MWCLCDFFIKGIKGLKFDILIDKYYSDSDNRY